MEDEPNADDDLTRQHQEPLHFDDDEDEHSEDIGFPINMPGSNDSDAEDENSVDMEPPVMPEDLSIDESDGSSDVIEIIDDGDTGPPLKNNDDDTSMPKHSFVPMHMNHIMGGGAKYHNIYKHLPWGPKSLSEIADTSRRLVQSIFGSRIAGGKQQSGVMDMSTKLGHPTNE
jgi:hypothetical protein